MIVKKSQHPLLESQSFNLNTLLISMTDPSVSIYYFFNTATTQKAYLRSLRGGKFYLGEGKFTELQTKPKFHFQDLGAYSFRRCGGGGEYDKNGHKPLG